MRHFVALDCETTGLPAGGNCFIVEVAALRFDESGQVYSQFTSLVKPPISIPADVTAINGITNEMVQDSPTFMEVAPGLMRILGDDPVRPTVISHNSVFDAKLITNELRRCGYNSHIDISIPVLCTMNFARRLNRFIRSYRLSYLTEFYNLVQADEPLCYHRAMEDCKHIKNLFMHLKGHTLTDDQLKQCKSFNITSGCDHKFVADDATSFYEPIYRCVKCGKAKQ